MKTDIDQRINIIIDEIFEDYSRHPVNLLGLDDVSNESVYLRNHKQDYIRTLADIMGILGKNTGTVKVLEIGSFLGIVSIALSKLGYDVTATDIEEFISCKNLQKKFSDNNVKYIHSNLRDYSIPFDDDEFDVIIICEVLEHLNFNPLPVMQEINRILKKHGIIYLSVPNIASFPKRVTLLEGGSIYNPIDDFFKQLDMKENMIVGLHWREYTAEEITEMLVKMGFHIKVKKYFPDIKYKMKNPVKKIIKRIISYILSVRYFRNVLYECLFDRQHDESLRETLVAIAEKKDNTSYTFHYTDATRG